MCRHLGWTGAPRTLAALLVDPPQGLLRQSYAPRLQSHGLVNADGFGAGWYVPQARAEPVRYRRSVPIWTDASFASLAPTVASGCVVAAVRSASVGMPIEETATAPFTRGRYLFSHNGRVEAAGLRGRLPPSAAAESPCDSAVLTELLWHRLGEPAAPLPAAPLPAAPLPAAPLPAAPLPAAPLPAVVAQVVLDAAECVPAGREQATLNVLVADGATLCATAWGETLYVRSEPDGVLIASEPGDAAAGWEQVPDRSLVVATAGAVAVTPLAGTSSPAGRPAATQPPASHPVPEEVS